MESSTTDSFVAVPGDAQTDFLPRGLYTSQGVRALAALSNPHDTPLALAVGDTHTDVAMLQAAELGFAPANAQRDVMRAAGIEVLRASYQAGLSEAVGRLLGHRPGKCKVCRPPDLAPRERALLALLAVPEAGRRGEPLRLLRLARARALASDRTLRPGSAGFDSGRRYAQIAEGR